MANQNIEIEIQVQVENTEPLLAFLKQNAKFISTNHQIDEYFTPPHRNFLAVRPAVEWLRLRDNDGQFSINYKNWHTDAAGKSHYCDEFETKIDNLTTLRKIFMALNYKTLTIVNKTRAIWHYQDYEVSLDSVAGLGDFIEVEYIGTNADINPKETTAGMVAFLKQHGCGQIKRNYQGYPFLLLFNDEAKHEVI